MTRSRKKWIACLVALIAASVGGLFLVATIQRESMLRHHAFGGYADAIGMYFLQNAALPRSIGELEAAYNRWDMAKVTLPTEPYYLRPTYRPPIGLTGTHYLVCIETVPAGSWLPSTYVVWANADGSGLDVDVVWNRRLSNVIAIDDQRRNQTPK